MEKYKKYKNLFKFKINQRIKNEWASRIKHWPTLYVSQEAYKRYNMMTIAFAKV